MSHENDQRKGDSMDKTNILPIVPPIEDVADQRTDAVPEVPVMVVTADQVAAVPSEPIRRFPTGATRDTDVNKLDFEGFFSPLVLERYGAYMHAHRKQSNGSTRESDNWQKGIPKEAYMKSGWRHFLDWWKEHRGFRSFSGYHTHYGIEDALCALIFNAMGYLHEILKERGYLKKNAGE